MAVSIDRVYQKVLALANKEQRGYITPQEFNLFADHAQMEIFEQYFYDVEQFERRVDSTAELTKRKIQIFKRFSQAINHGDTIPVEVYKIDASFFSSSGSGTVMVEELDRDDSNTFNAMVGNSPLTSPTKTRPIYMVVSNKIVFYPSETHSLGQYTINYIRKPLLPNWTYVIGANQNALFNPDPSAGWQDFELHASEESKLVIKILQLAGVAIKDFNLAQIAGQKEASVKQQEKQ
tara:strand:- start:7126 stop:7830 length:705 start_codon:yes stop_codon:yes gene_type:complete